MASSLFLTIFALFSTLAVGSAQNVTCDMDSITPVFNFTLAQVLGTWYTYGFFLPTEEEANPVDFSCLEVDQMESSSSPEFRLSIKEQYKNTTTEENYLQWDYAMVSERSDAIWKVFGFFDGIIRQSDVVYVQTDYENWALQYTCVVRNNVKNEDMTVWTRDRIPDPEMMAVIETIVHNYGYPYSVKIEQTGCD